MPFLAFPFGLWNKETLAPAEELVLVTGSLFSGEHPSFLCLGASPECMFQLMKPSMVNVRGWHKSQLPEVLVQLLREGKIKSHHGSPITGHGRLITHSFSFSLFLSSAQISIEWSLSSGIWKQMQNWTPDGLMGFMICCCLSVVELTKFLQTHPWEPPFP